MIKAKFRDHVRSKTPVAMVNEVLCKLICHNICVLVQEATRARSRCFARASDHRSLCLSQVAVGLPRGAAGLRASTPFANCLYPSKSRTRIGK